MNDFVSDSGGTRGNARERILVTAYELYARHGVRAVGMDDVAARAGVTRCTLDTLFPSEESLVLAFLTRREEAWTLDMAKDGPGRRAATPEERLLAVFDVIGDWLHHGADVDGQSFVNTLLEMGPEHPVGRAAIGYLANIRALVVCELATEAGLRDPDEFAKKWHILLKGAISAAAEGDSMAARRAQEMARCLMERHRDDSEHRGDREQRDHRGRRDGQRGPEADDRPAARSHRFREVSG